MAQNRTERKKDETRQKIIGVALGLFKEHGFDAVTMEQIAAEADFAKGTIYNYFPVKEAILDEYIRQSFSQQADERIARIRALKDTPERMSAILLELVEGIRRQPELFEKYFSYRIRQMVTLKQDESQASGFSALESEIIRLGQENGEIRQNLPPGLLLALFEFAFIEVAQLYYTNPTAFDAQTAVTQCVDLFMNGARRR